MNRKKKKNNQRPHLICNIVQYYVKKETKFQDNNQTYTERASPYISNIRLVYRDCWKEGCAMTTWLRCLLPLLWPAL